ncbi:hypothetical protein GALMADRAFT_206340 [Galerina marginata CBS 339.88]|uniref:Uncharacterized protein n=1 Tax=Galerina marginata (strain CBS 339.88) TaxID=685588 RepID=A0A067TH86_GALM3|nr:hypothetical protein GALMADRAFT_206340 [Galerina marginata CBS 339.88]
MPTSRVHTLPCRNAQYVSITALLYGTTSANPIRVPIRTRTTNELRNPIVEEAFGGHDVRIQIHDTQVTVHRGRQIHQFCIFVTNRQDLPLNAAIAALTPGESWRGNILVMRLGKKINGVVNLRADDGRLIRFVLRRFISRGAAARDTAESWAGRGRQWRAERGKLTATTSLVVKTAVHAIDAVSVCIVLCKFGQLLRTEHKEGRCI